MKFFYKKNLTSPKYGNLPTFSSECFDFPQLFKDQKVYKLISDYVFFSLWSMLSLC
jgi:hypothetical protein